MTNPLPTPKGPGDRRLANGRTNVELARQTDRIDPTSGRPVWRVFRTERFVTTDAARRWAEAMRQPGERANLCRYSPADGWRPHGVDTLTDDGWRGR